MTDIHSTVGHQRMHPAFLQRISTAVAGKSCFELELLHARSLSAAGYVLALHFESTFDHGSLYVAEAARCLQEDLHQKSHGLAPTKIFGNLRDTILSHPWSHLIQISFSNIACVKAGLSSTLQLRPPACNRLATASE